MRWMFCESQIRFWMILFVSNMNFKKSIYDPKKCLEFLKIIFVNFLSTKFSHSTSLVELYFKDYCFWNFLFFEMLNICAMCKFKIKSSKLTVPSEQFNFPVYYKVYAQCTGVAKFNIICDKIFFNGKTFSKMNCTLLIQFSEGIHGANQH